MNLASTPEGYFLQLGFDSLLWHHFFFFLPQPHFVAHRIEARCYLQGHLQGHSGQYPASSKRMPGISEAIYPSIPGWPW